MFHDIIYVIDQDTGKFYKREERWVGFHKPTRIRWRYKDQRGQENETTLCTRQPGCVAKGIQFCRAYKH